MDAMRMPRGLFVRRRHRVRPTGGIFDRRGVESEHGVGQFGPERGGPCVQVNATWPLDVNDAVALRSFEFFLQFWYISKF